MRASKTEGDPRIGRAGVSGESSQSIGRSAEPIIDEDLVLTLEAEPTSSEETASAAEHLCSTMRSTFRSNKSTESRSQRWHNEASPANELPNLWRQPGHLDDQVWKDPLNYVKSLREVKVQKRLAGDFIVSPALPGVTRSIELPPTPRCRGPPTQSPYDNAWRVGFAPAGRWVLERGRPKWVPGVPSMSLTQSSVEGWFCGYKQDGSQDCRSQGLNQYERNSDARPKTTPRNTKPGEFQQLSKPTSADTEDPCGPLPQRQLSCTSSSGSSYGSSCGGATDAARIIRHGQDVLKKSNKTNSFQVKQHAPLVKKKREDEEGDIEEIDDILMPLEGTQRLSEIQESIPRFSWVPHPIPNAGMDDSPRSSVTSARQHSTLKGEHLPLISSGRHLSKQFTKQQVCMMKKGLTWSPSSGASTSKKLSLTQKKDASRLGPQPTLGRVRRGSSAKLMGHPGSRSRDQRTELRRMTQSLLSSAQGAFESEVWESCGIEAEHLKRHHFASLIQSGLSLAGLFKLGGHKDDDNAQEQEEDGSATEPETPRHDETGRLKSTFRTVTLNKGKLGLDGDEQPSMVSTTRSSLTKASTLPPPPKSALRGCLS